MSISATENLGCIIILCIGCVFKERGPLPRGTVWTRCLLIMIALLGSPCVVSQRGTLRASYSVLSGLKIWERSCRHLGTEFIVLEGHFIPETVLGSFVSGILCPGPGLQMFSASTRGISYFAGVVGGLYCTALYSILRCHGAHLSLFLVDTL